MCKFHILIIHAISENTYAMQNMQYNYTVCSSITSQMHCTAQYLIGYFQSGNIG